MNLEFMFHVPVKIVFGPGKIMEAGELAKQFGDKALIITTGTFAQRTGLIEKLQRILDESGVASEHFPDVSPNPLSTEIDEGAELAKKTGCNVFIGLGGGSAMDAAKCISYAVGHDEPIWSYWIGQNELGTQALPVIAIPTTSGTASHVSPWAVITNPESKEKPGNGNESLYPKVGIVDPELMLTLPKEMTAVTTFDVLAHSLEGYVSNLANPMTDMFCEQAMRILGKYGRAAVNNGSDLEARTMMALADTLAGFSLSVAVVTLAHAISHGVSAVGDTKHGGALAALTPHTMRFSMNHRPEKFKHIGLFLRDEPKDKESWTVEDSAEEVERFIRDIEVDIPLKMQGIAEADIETIADHTMSITIGSVELDARVASRDEVIEIVTKAY